MMLLIILFALLPPHVLWCDVLTGCYRAIYWMMLVYGPMITASMSSIEHMRSLWLYQDIPEGNLLTWLNTMWASQILLHMCMPSTLWLSKLMILHIFYSFDPPITILVWVDPIRIGLCPCKKVRRCFHQITYDHCSSVWANLML